MIEERAAMSASVASRRCPLAPADGVGMDEAVHPSRPRGPRGRMVPALAALAVAALGTAALGLPGPAAAQVSEPAGEPTARSGSHEAPRQLLNSERIEQRFGSYGIEVLHSDERDRISHLYSVHDGARVGRTFAVVTYPVRIDPRFASEHNAILAGGSIGAVFAGRGWTVTKRHLHFGELRATERIAGLMGVDAGQRLAAHVYVLNVAKDGAAFDYATITEAHHPDYLTLEDLARIYGPPQAPDSNAARRILEAAVRQMH